MVEQVDWNFCCKVAETMESDKQEGITALSNGAILFRRMLNYIELATNRTRRQTRMLPRPQALVSGLFSGVAGLVSALISGLAS
jgi:hypothetical protein